jgi:drug/metabolite transporter (DMT)-like permease
MTPDEIKALEAIALEVVAVSIAAIIGFGFITWLLLRAAKSAPAAMVTLALSIITIIALFAYAVTRETSIVALVGTGLGALAGAVTYQLAGGTETPKTEPEPKPTPTTEPEEPSDGPA